MPKSCFFSKIKAESQGRFCITRVSIKESGRQQGVDTVGRHTAVYSHGLSLTLTGIIIGKLSR